MNSNETSSWLRTINWLRKTFPARCRVVVKSCLLKGFFGEADFIKGTFQIKISRKENFSTKIETLIHEWAHVLTWMCAEQDEDHGGEWGVIYAKIYSAFHKWDVDAEKSK